MHRRLELRRLCRPDRSCEGATAVALNSIGTDKAELQIESPLRHADRIEDVRAMAKALSQHAVPNQLVRIKDGDWKRFSLRILRGADPRRS